MLFKDMWGRVKPPTGPSYTANVHRGHKRGTPECFAEIWVRTRKEKWLALLRTGCFWGRCRGCACTRSRHLYEGVGSETQSANGDWTTTRVSLRSICK